MDTLVFDTAAILNFGHRGEPISKLPDVTKP
jgi:hypothetical protein